MELCQSWDEIGCEEAKGSGGEELFAVIAVSAHVMETDGGEGECGGLARLKQSCLGLSGLIFMELRTQY